MGFNLDELDLEGAARQFAELFVEIYRNLEDRPVSRRPPFDELMEHFRGSLSEDGEGIPRLMEQLRQVVLPTSMGIPHPLYMGLVNSSPLPAAALTDLIVSALNNNGGGFEQSPPMYAAEEEVIRAFSELFGYEPDESAGILLPGGSFAVLHGILLARTQHFPDWGTHGPWSLEGKPTLYVSEACHFSITRAAMAVGLGAESVIPIPVTGRGSMDVKVLDERIDEDRRSGRVPFCVAATAGTTGTGAIDPLNHLADLCQRERMWMHVDACYGGAAILVDELAPRFSGIERADSISVDPHKWFFIPMVAGLALTRHPEVETAAFDVTPSYIPQTGVVDRYRRGFASSRRGSGLTVWAGLHAHGWGTVREAVRRNITLSRALENALSAAGFHVLGGGELSVVCARWEPDDWEDEALDDLQMEIASAVADTGLAWFGTVFHEHRRWLRFNLVNLYVTEAHVQKLVKLLSEVASRVSEG